MREFQDDHPDYQAYSDDHYAVASMPYGTWNGIKGLVHNACVELGEDDMVPTLRVVVDAILTSIPTGPTSASFYDQVKDELDRAVSGIARKPLHTQMDALGKVVDVLAGTSFSDKLNEYLEEQDFGYYVESNQFGAGLHWELRDENSADFLATVEAAAEVVASVSTNAAEHLRQLRKQLQGKSDRELKDALRDALSAMESLYKSVSGKPGISPAETELLTRTTNPTERKAITDGKECWSIIHRDYPDIRHGHSTTTLLGEEDARYWIERILAAVRIIGSKFG